MAGIVGFSAGFAAIKSQADRISLYLGLLAFMQAGLMGLFASVDIFFYYLFHEFALIPTFIMIGLTGRQGIEDLSPWKSQSTLPLGALISLGGLVALNVLVDAPKFDFPSLSEAILSDGLGVGTQKKIFALLLFGFGILVALFPFHTWAPRGYEVHLLLFPCCMQWCSQKVWTLWIGPISDSFVTCWRNFMGTISTYGLL